MLDIQLLRGDLNQVAERLAKRGFKLDTAGFQALEAERKAVQVETQGLQARRNALSKQIGQAKHGMQTLNQSLHSLLQRRLISMEDALARSPDPAELEGMNAGGGAKKL